MTKQKRNAFEPDWSLEPEQALAVTLNLSLNKNVPGWPGCTDDQLDAIARDVIEHVELEAKALGFAKLKPGK